MWMTIEEACQRLGITPQILTARAKQAGWTREERGGPDGRVIIQFDVLTDDAPNRPNEERKTLEVRITRPLGDNPRFAEGRAMRRCIEALGEGLGELMREMKIAPRSWHSGL